MEVLKSLRTPLPIRGAVRAEQPSVPLMLYRLNFPGEDSPDLALRNWVHGSTRKQGIHLAGDRRRQFRFQEIKHHDNRLLGVLLADPCFLYNKVYYLFVHGELSTRA